MKFLVRDSVDKPWEIEEFLTSMEARYLWSYAIPYEGNELLEGTCEEYNPPWNPKEGTLIAVYDDRYQEWQARVLVCKSVKGDGWWCVDGGYTLEAHRKGLAKATKWARAEPLENHFDME